MHRDNHQTSCGPSRAIENDNSSERISCFTTGNHHMPVAQCFNTSAIAILWHRDVRLHAAKRRLPENPTASSSNNGRILTLRCDELPPMKHQKMVSQGLTRIETVKPMLQINTPADPASPVKRNNVRLTLVSADGTGLSDKFVGYRIGVEDGRGGGILK